MFSITPQTPPTFSFARSHQQDPKHTHNHRPSYPSPLSSSPIRASSTSPQHQPAQFTFSQPLSPCDPNSRHGFFPAAQTQSSPIFGSGVSSSSTFNSNSTSNIGERNGNNSTKFRFASCNPRQANPLLKRREDVQEGRRRLFFQNVRQRREEGRWEMRGGEDELHKLEFWRLSREQRQARDAEAERYLRGLDADLVAMEEEELRRYGGGGEDIDAMRVDAIARQEQAEMDALISGLEGGGGGSSHFSDEDDDYDGIFMELAQQQEGGQGMGFEQDVEMT